MHLREGVTPARFKAALAGQIRAGQPKAWEVARARPLAVRYKGRFKSAVTVRSAPRRALGDQPAPGQHDRQGYRLVLRYFVGLVAVKLGAKMKGFCVPVDEQ